MSNTKNILAAALVAVVVGGGFMAYDKMRGAEWVVSPQEIAEAQAQGKPGVESRPGTVTVLPIRSETADVLPMKWALYGLIAGILVFVSLRKKQKAA